MKKSLLSLILFTIFITGCDENKQSPKQMEIPKVEVLNIKPQDIPLTFEFTARAQGSKETEVRARVGGILLKRNYKEGSDVKEGSILFQIDPEPYEIALKQAEAKLAQNQAELKNAETQLERTQTLFQKGYASQKTLDDATAKSDSLKATVQMSEANVDEAKLNLSYTTVTAPISGLTSLETQSEGSLISTTDKTGILTTITQINPIYVLFSVSENELMAITNMVDSGKVKNPRGGKDIYAKLELSDGSIYNEDGKIDFITPNIDTSTGTVTLRAVFPNAQNRIRPGQFLRLILEGLIRINALVVPQSAVMQDANGSYVYCLDKDNIVKMVPVKIGLDTANNEWIIDNGLKPNDKVIVSDLMKLRQGMTVIPQNIDVKD